MNEILLVTLFIFTTHSISLFLDEWTKESNLSLCISGTIYTGVEDSEVMGASVLLALNVILWMEYILL